MNEFDKLKSFLGAFGIQPGSIVSQNKLEIMVSVSEKRYGKNFAAVVMDCFDPEGANENKRQSEYQYCFDWSSWEEFEKSP